MDNKDKKYIKVNIPLLIFDIILLPIHIVRMVIIYFCGSKYNLRGFQFLDVIMHADNPYFNQEDCRVVNTIETDYRVVIREDSRIFPIDIDRYIEVKKYNIKEDIITGDTVCNEKTKWNIASDECNKPKIVDSKDNCDEKQDTFIKGVNYFGDNDNDNEKSEQEDHDDDIIDSIRDELNNIFDN